MIPKGNVLTGARARFTIDAKVVGYATGVTINEETQYEPIEVLDNIEVAENVPIGYRVSMTADRVRLIDGSMRGTMNVEAKVGADSTAHLANLHTRGLSPMDAVLEDPITGKIYALVTDVKIETKNLSVTPRGIIGENVSFVAIRMLDETEA